MPLCVKTLVGIGDELGVALRREDIHFSFGRMRQPARSIQRDR